MGRFLTTGELTPSVRRDYWKVTKPFKYEIDSGRVITVPVGFETDGASVPKFLWWALPAWGIYQAGAVLHDYLISLYRKGTPHPEGQTPAAIDNVFRLAMKDNETGWFLRTFMYSSVRLFGWRAK